jgi:hypothetical protein
MREHGKKSQPERFKESAREVGANEADDALDRVMGRLDLTKKPEPEPKKENGHE